MPKLATSLKYTAAILATPITTAIGATYGVVSGAIEGLYRGTRNIAQYKDKTSNSYKWRSDLGMYCKEYLPQLEFL